jgi:DNA mismatch endonuclease (patch repair protein)
MSDVFTIAERSAVMRAVRSRDTSPERVVRKIVSALGVRYRLHGRKVPGNPDLVFPRLKKVVFVHGCFWHRHRCPKGYSMPASRVKFWQAKFARNTARDAAVKRLLRREGWRALVVWECQLKPERIDRTTERLRALLLESRLLAVRKQTA